MAIHMRWRTILATVAVAYGVLALGGLAFVYSGLYDVGATARHWPITGWLLQTARARSIAARARGITTPPNLATDANLLMGIDHFSTHCAVCHGAPGVPKGDIAEGLYPQPPALTDAAKQFTPGELFWILKHGIKMTGMPAWSDHTDPELWAIVAFLEKLPTMSEGEYAKLIMTNAMHGGMHDHMGAEERPVEKQ